MDFLGENAIRKEKAQKGIREQVGHQPGQESLPEMADTFLRSFDTPPKVREVHNVIELEFNQCN